MEFREKETITVSLGKPSPQNTTTTWRTLLEKEMAEQEDSMNNVVDIVGDLDKPWYVDCGLPEHLMTVWTLQRVYFPVVYDCCWVFVCSAPRFPQHSPEHIVM